MDRVWRDRVVVHRARSRRKVSAVYALPAALFLRGWGVGKDLCSEIEETEVQGDDLRGVEQCRLMRRPSRIQFDPQSYRTT